ncbi:hypothetical protein CLU84_0768 [Comamonas sp. 26]|nr:hypothetical protein CLU84_0768 [Comamonas sp. 26]
MVCCKAHQTRATRMEKLWATNEISLRAQEEILNKKSRAPPSAAFYFEAAADRTRSQWPPSPPLVYSAFWPISKLAIFSRARTMPE